MSKNILTVRELMRKLLEMNPEAEVQSYDGFPILDVVNYNGIVYVRDSRDKPFSPVMPRSK